MRTRPAGPRAAVGWTLAAMADARHAIIILGTWHLH